MQKNKKLLSACITMLLFSLLSNLTAWALPVNYGDELANMPSKSYSQTFTDVPQSFWAFSYIAEMAERDVLAGYPNGYFYPNNNVTRGEFAKIMTLAAGVNIVEPYYSSFEDVSVSDWYSPYIEAARYYLSGYEINGDYYYMPNTVALREDIAVALVKLKGYDTTGYDTSILTAMFTDWQSISESARKYVAVAVEKGLVSGYDDNTFKGQAGVTRAETATLLWRAYQYGNDNKEFDQIPTPTPAPTATIAPTTVPTATPKPTPSAAPVTTQTPAPTAAPTATPKPSSGKSYAVNTLTTAKISDTTRFATDDGTYLYYYDSSDNTVYKLNMDSGKKSVLVDISDLEYKEYETKTTTVTKTVEKQVPKTVIKQVEREIPVEDTDEATNINPDETSSNNEEASDDSGEKIESQTQTKTIIEEVEETVYETVTEEIEEEVTEDILIGTYSDYQVGQVYYNTGNNKLLLFGYYKSYLGARNSSKKSCSKCITYDLSSGKAKKYSEATLGLDNFTFIAGNMDDGMLLVANDINDGFGFYTCYTLIKDSKTFTTLNKLSGNNELMFAKGNNLYGMDDEGVLEKYDFTSKDWKKQWNDSMKPDAYGLKDNTFYLWEIADGSIITIESDGEPKVKNIDLKNDIEILDFKNMPTADSFNKYEGGYYHNRKIYKRMFITNDESFIFYDTATNSWRKIEKN